jgi:hypothetical protein
MIAFCAAAERRSEEAAQNNAIISEFYEEARA